MKFLGTSKYIETLYGDCKVFCPICNGEGFCDKTQIGFFFDLMAMKGKKHFKLKYENIRDVIWKGKELVSRKELRQTDIYFKGVNPTIPILIDKVRVYGKGKIGGNPEIGTQQGGDGHIETKYYLIDGSHRLLMAIDNDKDPLVKIRDGIKQVLAEVWGTHHENFLMHPEKHDETAKTVREQYPDTLKGYNEDAIVQIHHKKQGEFLNIPWADPYKYQNIKIKMYNDRFHQELARDGHVDVKLRLYREGDQDGANIMGMYTKDGKFVPVNDANAEQEVKE